MGTKKERGKDMSEVQKSILGQAKEVKRSPYFKDLTGKKFGKWIVVNFAGIGCGGNAIWLCRCSCGIERDVLSRSLIAGVSRCCGHDKRNVSRHNRKKYDLVGKKFGYWTVIRRVKGMGRSRGGQRAFLCQCICKTRKVIRAKCLTNGQSKSCGCVNKGNKHSHWKGGRMVEKRGYISVYCPGHPNSRRNRIPEHVLVMSNKLGRPLRRNELVHHLNGITDDNRIENLELWHDGHPHGQRVSDKLKFYLQFIKTYDPSWLDQTTERFENIKPLNKVR